MFCLSTTQKRQSQLQLETMTNTILFPISVVQSDTVSQQLKKQKHMIKSRNICTHREWSLFHVSNASSHTTSMHKYNLVITTSYQYRKTAKWLYTLKISKQNNLINILPLSLLSKLCSWATSIIFKYVINKHAVSH